MNTNVLLTLHWNDGTTTVWVVDPDTEPAAWFSEGTNSHVGAISVEYTTEQTSGPIRSVAGQSIDADPLDDDTVKGMSKMVLALKEAKERTDADKAS